MLPSLRHGDSLLVEFGAVEPRLGDIAVFEAPRGIVVHRVVRHVTVAGAVCIQTKGDARLDFDAPVHADDVLGIVRSVRAGADGPSSDGACTGLRARAIAAVSASVGLGEAWAREPPVARVPGLRRIGARAARAAQSLAARVLRTA